MDIGARDTPRWVQRFQNFDGALVLMRIALELLDEDNDRLDPEVVRIMREGAIQRFEYTFELAWKTLKDYLEWRKVTLERKGPADVIKAAFDAGYIEEGQDWMDALDARNEMSHVYRQQAFERVLVELRARFHARFEDLHEMLLLERMKLMEAKRDADRT